MRDLGIVGVGRGSRLSDIPVRKKHAATTGGAQIPPPAFPVEVPGAA